ncbi:MAG: LytR/AlgR family response regulator transcription factor [Bacteroidota bacterium]
MKIQCLIVDDEPLARALIRSHANRVQDLFIVSECASAFDAIEVLQKQQVDLIFLDIRMPELDGLQFLKALSHPPEVIFTTAYREFGADAYDLNALDYLVKPISFERFLKAVNKFTGRLMLSPAVEGKEAGWFYVTANRKKVRVEISRVVLVESLDDHVKIHIEGQVITTRDTITSIGALLPSRDFVRIHRSFIVAIARVQQVTGEGVEVANRFLPFGRSYRLQALEVLGLG